MPTLNPTVDDLRATMHPLVINQWQLLERQIAERASAGVTSKPNERPARPCAGPEQMEQTEQI